VCGSRRDEIVRRENELRETGMLNRSRKKKRRTEQEVRAMREIITEDFIPAGGQTQDKHSSAIKSILNSRAFWRTSRHADIILSNARAVGSLIDPMVGSR